MKKQEVNWFEVILTKENVELVLPVEQQYLIFWGNKLVGSLTNPEPVNQTTMRFSLQCHLLNPYTRKRFYKLPQWAFEQEHANLVKRYYPSDYYFTQDSYNKIRFQNAKSKQWVNFFIEGDSKKDRSFVLTGNKKSILLKGPYPASEEIDPPWIFALSYAPWDIFWRQSGEAWIYYIWLPFWHSLEQQKKEEFLNQWNAPKDWRTHLMPQHSDDEEEEEESSEIVSFLLNEHLK